MHQNNKKMTLVNTFDKNQSEKRFSYDTDYSHLVLLVLSVTYR